MLGLSGITVKRRKCRDVKSHRPHYPAPPSEMQALIAFTADKGKKIKGLTELSYCLEGKEESVSSTGIKKELEKHVAVWGKDQQLGSVVTFEDSLSSTKNFGLTIAMAEEGSDIALPLGVSNIQLNGDECESGSALTLHIPVVPTKNDTGLTALPMLAVPSSTTRASGWKKKKNKKLPSAPKQEAFSQVYTMEALQKKAVLRILLEVYEKGSPMEKYFVGKRIRGETVDAVEGSIPTIFPTLKKEEPEKEPGRLEEEPATPSTLYTMEDSPPTTPQGSPSRTVDSTFSMGSTTMASNTTNFESQTEDESCWGSINTGTIDDDITIDTNQRKSIEIVHDDVETLDSTVVDDDLKFLSFLNMQSCIPTTMEESTGETLPTLDFTIFGRKISIPTCGSTYAA